MAATIAFPAPSLAHFMPVMGLLAAGDHARGEVLVERARSDRNAERKGALRLRVRGRQSGLTTAADPPFGV